MPETPSGTDTPDAPEAPPKKKGASNLAVRFATAGVGIPILLWMLYYAPAWAFSCVGFVAAAIGASELAGMTLKGERALQAWMVLCSMLITGVFVFVPDPDVLVTLGFGVVVAGALAVLARPDPIELAGARMAWLIGGPLYIGAAIAAVAKLHHFESGGTWVVLACMLAWGSDTGGYFAGKAFGKHKLYEKISPKKTIEGSIGGLATIVLMALAVSYLWLPELSMPHAVALALVAGATGQAGDLCISVIKRSNKIKDSGFIIPGHGGLLDRIDALMFTAIVTWLYAHWLLELPATVPVIGS